MTSDPTASASLLRRRVIPTALLVAAALLMVAYYGLFYGASSGVAEFSAQLSSLDGLAELEVVLAEVPEATADDRVGHAVRVLVADDLVFLDAAEPLLARMVADGEALKPRDAQHFVERFEGALDSAALATAIARQFANVDTLELVEEDAAPLRVLVIVSDRGVSAERLGLVFEAARAAGTEDMLFAVDANGRLGHLVIPPSTIVPDEWSDGGLEAWTAEVASTPPL